MSLACRSTCRPTGIALSPDERLFLEICNINIRSNRFPIPVQPLMDFPESW